MSRFSRAENPIPISRDFIGFVFLGPLIGGTIASFGLLWLLLLDGPLPVAGVAYLAGGPPALATFVAVRLTTGYGAWCYLTSIVVGGLASEAWFFAFVSYAGSGVHDFTLGWISVTGAVTAFAMTFLSPFLHPGLLVIPGFFGALYVLSALWS